MNKDAPFGRRTTVRKSTGVSGDNSYLHLSRGPSDGLSRRYSQRRSNSTAGNNSDTLLIKPTKKKQLFDWDDIGLGLEMDVSSGTTSGSDASIPRSRAPIPADPNPPSLSHLQSQMISESDIPQPSEEWVRNLVELRRAKLRQAENFVGAGGQEWLEEQHRALEKGVMPVTLNCILAASGISSRFDKSRNDFMKLEYRSRYWHWAENFMALIDYFISHGHIRVAQKPSKKYQRLINFVDSSQKQKDEGKLSAHRDQLLTALGMQWEEKRKYYESDEDEESDSDSDDLEDTNADETWEAPATGDDSPRGRRPDLRKRQRRQPVEEVNDFVSKSWKTTSRPPIVEPRRRSMLEWGKQFVEIRQYFKKGNTYAIPSNRPHLQIWMNTEIARGSTGTLSAMCCAVLKAARLADSFESVVIDSSCEAWCRTYIDYVDFVLEHEDRGASAKRAPQRVTDFLFDCREDVIDRLISQDKTSLLRAVDEGWLQSKLMETSISRNSRKQIRKKRSFRNSERAAPADSYESEGAVVEEVVLDYGNHAEEPSSSRKKRKKSNLLCQKMVSSMIKGIVGENIEGRKRTAAEKDAEAWVVNAGAKALNTYARNWFRTATVD